MSSHRLGAQVLIAPLPERVQRREEIGTLLGEAVLEVEVEALNRDPSPVEALTVPGVFEHLERIVGGGLLVTSSDRTLAQPAHLLLAAPEMLALPSSATRR